ncbi:hypothetical protein ABFS82_10G125100 [Erythranthe guttata]|uniref:uncharacterized protein LOC105960254 n=1 Tax=Erythranthe guttata TaxID=4155 RepID=UPI00064DD2B0|nr:PREDICTED: uncharacterized protein LOC105960254 [Erythranthe guttata]|eukprot:XP_012839875.1 PREDICTED: uncharacterized protein LOC105960254 [Erythranthe guttata]
MSKKGKVVIFDSTPSYGGVLDPKSMLKHQNLMQDYQDLQKEADVMTNNLEAARQRKLILAAEVRFLRQRYKYLMERKNVNPPQEQIHEHAPNPHKQTKLRKEPNPKKKPSVVKQVSLIDASPITDHRPRKKISLHGGKEATRQNSTLMFTPVSDSNHRGTIHVRKEYLAPNLIPILGRNQNERMLFGANDAVLRKSIAAFDLNQDSGKEASLPSKAPIFDLNEISTGDEDIQQSNYEAVKKSLMRGVNEEEQNELKLSIMCRNGGEGSSRVGKRKISWQDPVALRV